MRLLAHPLYRADVQAVGGLPLPWERLQDAAVVLTGATGMIGHFLVDVLQYRNRRFRQGCRICVLGRSARKAADCFREYWDRPGFSFIRWDAGRAPDLPPGQAADYVLHLASATHPAAYAAEPIDTILANVEGLNRVLAFSCGRGTRRVLFASSCEIYGAPADGEASFTEQSCGRIDCNTLRAGYPESKRAGEALCQAYRRQRGLDVVIPRLSRTFGPTMLPSDSKAAAQFIRNGAAGENIVLKSAGRQTYSYCYAADAASGLLACLLLGASGEAYNVAAEHLTLRELASAAAEAAGVQVVTAPPDPLEAAGFSGAERSVLDTRKLRALGWTPQWRIVPAIRRTVQILSDIGEGAP